MADSIVAIDLGTSHITGIVGEKNTDGTFSIKACETEEALSCVRRGNVYNLNETAIHVKNLISKLEHKLQGAHIDMLYVGVGGQSLCTIDHSESKEIADNNVVTESDVKELDAMCERYIPDLLDVLYVTPAVYYADEHREPNPVGVPCKQLEARYKIVVGRTSVRRNIIGSIDERANKKIAGIVVAPLALADAVLMREDKELGCALIDFGAGVTTLSVYKGGNLVHMSVIPLGNGLITRDITTLQLTEAEAERLKIEYGNVFSQKDNDNVIRTMNREIKENDLNVIVEARIKEIVDNVFARLNEAINIKSLGAGIVIAGGASSLKNLREMVAEKSELKVRPAIIRDGVVRNADEILGDPSYMLAISLMLKGTESCVTPPFAPIITEEPVDESDNKKDNGHESSGGFFLRKKKTKKEPKSEDGKRDGSSWKDKIGDLFKDMD